MNPTSPQIRSKSSRLFSFTAAGVASLAVVLTASLRGAAPAAAPATPPATPAPAAAAPAAPAAPAAKAAVFADIKPLLEKYCYSCHGGDASAAAAGGAAGSRSKSALTMDTLENLTKGGRSKKAGVVAGKADESEIIVRMKLAAAKGRGFMPPGANPAVPADEIKKIADWINAGAK